MSWERTQRSMVSDAIGAGAGELFYLVDDKAQDDAYYWLLKKRGIRDSKIFTALSDAYDATTDDRNDCVLAYPGTHTQTAKITWAKVSTHLIGVGSKNQRMPATAGTNGCVYFPCTSAMTELFLITGHHCQFQNFSTYLSTATGAADVRVQGRNVTLQNLFMKGGQHATQFADAALGYSLWVDAGAAGYAHGLSVLDCHIGDSRNSSSGDGATPRTTGGQILLSGQTNAGSHVEFKRNVISGWSATNACSAVFHTSGLDRLILWEDCTFYNFQSNLGTVLSGGVFTDTCGTTHLHLLSGKTCQYGFEDWSTGTKTYLYVAMPTSSGTGGTALIATTS